jgi:hypothetical protein
MPPAQRPQQPQQSTPYRVVVAYTGPNDLGPTRLLNETFLSYAELQRAFPLVAANLNMHLANDPNHPTCSPSSCGRGPGSAPGAAPRPDGASAPGFY